MDKQPSLYTQRLVLRPFVFADHRSLTILAGNKRIADTTASIPHPYPEHLAKQWINSHPAQWNNQDAVIFAIIQCNSHQLVGSIALMNWALQQAELGYWIGVPYWNRGYATEACLTIIHFSFQILGIKRLYAQCLTRNIGSTNVLKKVGFIHTGRKQATCGYRQQMESIEEYELLQANYLGSPC